MSWTRTRSSLALVLILFAARAAGAKQKESPAEKEAAAHYKQGRAFYDAGVYDKAIVEFEAAYRLAPRPLLLYHIGRSHHGLGNKPVALDHLRRFVAEEPDNKAADDARGRIAQLEREIQEAEAAAAEARRRAEEEAIASRRAEAAKLADEGSHDAAVREYEILWDLTHDPETLFSAATVRKRQGAKADAIAAYKRYLEAAPDGVSAAQARAEVAALEREMLEVVEPVPSPDPPFVPPVEKRERRIKWGWVGGGAATLAVGVVADVVPASGKNGELDATDFIPVGLYALGAVAVALGIL